MTHITVPDQDPFVEFAVTTAQSSFAFAFTYFDATDLRVTVDGAELTQSQFGVSGTSGFDGGYPGGTVVLNNSVSNCQVQIWSAIPPVRINDFSEGAGFPSLSVNTELDRATARMRDMRLRMERIPVLTFANSTTLTADNAGQLFTNKNQAGSFTLTLPVASAGLEFEFACVAAESFVITVHSGDAILNGASGTSLTASAIGAYLTLRAIDVGKWAVKNAQGTWSLT